MTEAPTTISYASVMFRETVKIVLMIAIFNYLEVKSTCILSQASVTEKVWTTLGHEFDTCSFY